MFVYINCDKLTKEESVTKNSSKVSGIKATDGGKILQKVTKKINTSNNLQTKHSSKSPFQAFNIYTFRDRVSLALLLICQTIH